MVCRYTWLGDMCWCWVTPQQCQMFYVRAVTKKTWGIANVFSWREITIDGRPEAQQPPSPTRQGSAGQAVALNWICGILYISWSLYASIGCVEQATYIKYAIHGMPDLLLWAQYCNACRSLSSQLANSKHRLESYCNAESRCMHPQHLQASTAGNNCSCCLTLLLISSNPEMPVCTA